MAHHVERIKKASEAAARARAALDAAEAALYREAREAYVDSVKPSAIRAAWLAGGYARSRDTISKACQTGTPGRRTTRGRQ